MKATPNNPNPQSVAPEETSEGATKTVAAAVEQPLVTPSLAKQWLVEGLEKSDFMPIRFEGREWDLANISDEDAQYLYARGCEFIVWNF